jgi:hypothetical protein
MASARSRSGRADAASPSVVRALPTKASAVAMAGSPGGSVSLALRQRRLEIS